MEKGRILFSAFFISMLVCGLCSQLHAGMLLNIIDTPTSYSLLRGYCFANFNVYGNGGISTRIAIGLTDHVTLGISEDVEGAVGQGQIRWHIPGVIARLNLFSPESYPVGFAIGYDAFYLGELSKTASTLPQIITHNDGTSTTNARKELIYGIYFAFTRPFILLNGQSRAHWGLRVPLLPALARSKGENTSLYSSVDIPIGTQLIVMAEIENIYFDIKRFDEIIYNAGVHYNITESFGLSLKLQYCPDRNINPSQKPSRIITLEYQGLFY